VLEPAEHDEASHWRPKKTFGHVMPQEPNVTCFHVRYTDCTCYQDELAVVINEIKKGNWKFSTIFSSQERLFLPLERRDLCNFDKYVCQVEMMDTWVALVPSLNASIVGQHLVLGVLSASSAWPPLQVQEQMDRVGQHQAQVLVLVQVWGEVEYLNHVHQKHHTSVHQAFVSFYPLHIDFK